MLILTVQGINKKLWLRNEHHPKISNVPLYFLLRELLCFRYTWTAELCDAKERFFFYLCLEGK